MVDDSELINNNSSSLSDEESLPEGSEEVRGPGKGG